MLITQAFIQTPIIFSLIISLFIKTQTTNILTLTNSLRLMASGICIGLGSIGPAIGLSLFSRAAIRGLGINNNAYRVLLPFTLLSQAIIETPIIFAFIIALTLLLFIQPATITTEQSIAGVIYIAAAICTGIGTIGPGISSGKTAAATCTSIAYDPSLHSTLSRVSLFAQALIETSVIYSVLISFLLLLFG